MSDRGLLFMVDDNEADILLMEEALREAHASRTLVAVTSVDQAKLFLLKAGEFTARGEIDLILLDINLPRISGLVLLEWIKDQPALRAVPVVMYSSSRLEKESTRALALGAARHLTKPAQWRELVKLASDVDRLADELHV